MSKAPAAPALPTPIQKTTDAMTDAASLLWRLRADTRLSEAEQDAIRKAHAALMETMQPTHQHIKRGTLYTEAGRGHVQTDKPLKDMDMLVAYIGEDGKLWFRAPAEFDDVKRFKRLGF